MKSKIIDSYTDEKEGFSRVTIQNKYGKFTGYSYCHPDDKDAFSIYAGERYAELRAYKEYAKFRLKQEKIKLQTIENLLKDIKNDLKNNHVPFINFSIPIRKIYLKKRDYTRSVSDWENLYNYYEQAIKKQDEIRQDLLAKAAAKKVKNN